MEQTNKSTFVMEVLTDKPLSAETRKQIVDRLEEAFHEIDEDIFKPLGLLVTLTLGAVKKPS